MTRRSLTILISLFAILVCLVSVGCEDEEVKPTTVPVATIEATIQSPATLEFTPEALATPGIYRAPDLVTPTPTPATGHKVTEHSVIFLLDNSESLTKAPEGVKKCLPPDNNAYADVDLIDAMFDLTSYVTRLLIEVHRHGGQNLSDVSVGIYLTTPGEEPAYTAVEVQQVPELITSTKWQERLRERLLVAEDAVGYAESFAHLRDEVINPTDSTTLIFITDGYFGVGRSVNSDEVESRVQRETRENLESLLDSSDDLQLRIIQFQCPNLAEDPDYTTDQAFWDRLDNRSNITYTLFPNDDSGYQQGGLLEAIIRELFEETDLQTMLPGSDESGPEQIRGRDWFSPEQFDTEQVAIAGNTSAFDLRVFSLEPQGYFELLLTRDNNELRRPLSTNGGAIFYTTGSEIDDLLGRPTSTCDPIEWSLSGSGGLSFYWWEARGAEHEISNLEISSSEVLNNGPMEIKVEVSGDAKEAFLDCYELSVVLHDGSHTIHEFRAPLSELNRHLIYESTVEDYQFEPGSETGATLEIQAHILERNRAELVPGSLVAVSTITDTVSFIYQPEFNIAASKCDDTACRFVFDFSGPPFHPPIDWNASRIRAVRTPSMGTSTSDGDSFECDGLVIDPELRLSEKSKWAPVLGNSLINFIPPIRVDSNEENIIVEEDSIYYGYGQTERVGQHFLEVYIHSSTEPVANRLRECGFRGVLVEWGEVEEEDWIYCELNAVEEPCHDLRSIRSPAATR